MSKPSPLDKANEILARPIGYSSRTADKFVVRLPDGMRERIGDIARKNHRSMNSEIIDKLDMHIALVDMGHGPLLEALFKGQAQPNTSTAPVERVRAGDPAVFNDTVWIVDKLEVKGNVVYASISRENPANSMPESKIVRHSALSAFAE